MTKEKWKEIKGTIKDKFKVEDEGSEHLDDEGGVDIEFIEFTGPIGKIRLELVEKPVIIDKKTFYTRRIGSETNIEYVYSESEKSTKMTAYKWSDLEDDWIEMEVDGMFS